MIRLKYNGYIINGKCVVWSESFSFTGEGATSIQALAAFKKANGIQA